MIQPIVCDDENLRRLWATDATVVEIGAAIGASRTWVSDCARKLGLPPRAVNTGSLPVAKIEHAYVALQLSAEEIRNRLLPQFPTLSETTIKRVLKNRGVKMRPGKLRGSDAYVTECVRLFRAGWRHRDIAARLGLTTSQVGHRCRRILGAGPRGKCVKIDPRRVLSLHRQGQTLRQIASELGVSSQSVYYHVAKARRSGGL